MNKATSIILGAFLLAISADLRAADGLSSPQDQVKTPGRPADFKPFRFKYSTEELMEKFSTNQMQRADAELKQIQAVNDKGPWKPTWESLDQHSAPEWFLDAKLGIMLNWGIHSVPAWDRDRGDKTATYPDAYGCEMYRDEVVMPHHAKNWGADFQWDDFIPMWNAEHFDPEAMISLFQEAGAKYLITMSKHHDGMAWWDSEWTKRNTVQMGPKKDLFTPLMAAAKRHNFKTEMYFCYEEWATAMIGDDGKPCYRRWDWGTYRGTFPLSPDIRRFSGTIPVKNYYDQYMIPLVKEMIDRFDPDGLWGDGEWATPAETLRSKELIAYFYNKAQGRKEVIANDRIGQGPRDHHGDFFASEYNSTQSYDHPWEENQGISKSFAYNYEDNDESLGPPSRLIHLRHEGAAAPSGGIGLLYPQQGQPFRLRDLPGVAGNEPDTKRRSCERRGHDHDARCRGATKMEAGRTGLDDQYPGEASGRKGASLSTCVGDQDSHATHGGDFPEGHNFRSNHRCLGLL